MFCEISGPLGHAAYRKVHDLKSALWRFEKNIPVGTCECGLYHSANNNITVYKCCSPISSPELPYVTDIKSYGDSERFVLPESVPEWRILSKCVRQLYLQMSTRIYRQKLRNR